MRLSLSFLCVFVILLECLFVSIFTYAWVSVYVYVSVVCVLVFLFVCMCLLVPMSVHGYVYVCVCVSMYPCTSAHKKKKNTQGDNTSNICHTKISL